jgi:hypothetical protein
MENCLLLIQKMYQDGSIDDSQRDALKGNFNCLYFQIKPQSQSKISFYLK